MSSYTPLQVERRSIDVIPAAERHGSPLNQFTLWMGANLQITAIVDGALAVVFGADALWAIIGLLIGNLAGGCVMALHSAQGPRLGLPQMISSRAQFGVYGAAIPLVLVIVMYLGFTATGTVLAGQAINALLHVDLAAVGIVIFVVLVGVIATFGHELIHTVGKVATFMCAATTVTAFTGRSTMGRSARAVFVTTMLAIAAVIALAASADFLDNFKNFVLLLLMVFTPWSAINLTDYYLISKEKVDIPALYDPHGRYGGWNMVAITTYALGVLVQVPFLAQSLYTGPVTEALGGADISWIVGLVAPAVIYYLWASRNPVAPDRMIHPPAAPPPNGQDAASHAFPAP